MIKIDCKECGKAFDVEERDKWKTKCNDCFSKGRLVTITPKPTPLQEMKAQAKADLDNTTKRIMMGNCLNAGGNALSGSCPEPKQHYAYAKELFEIWLADELGIKKEEVEEELVK